MWKLVVHGAGLGLLTKKATRLGAELAQLKVDYGMVLHQTVRSER